MWPSIARAHLGLWSLVLAGIVGGCSPDRVVLGPEDVERWISETRAGVCTDRWPCSQDDEDIIVASLGLPYGAESYWKPSRSAVQQFERRLSFAFEQANSEYRANPPDALWLYDIQYIGFEETADGVWDVYFFDRLLARLDERDFKLRA